MAIDRHAMLQNVFDSLGAIGYGPFPRSLATADTTLRLPPYDPAHAAGAARLRGLEARARRRSPAQRQAVGGSAHRADLERLAHELRGADSGRAAEGRDQGRHRRRAVSRRSSPSRSAGRFRPGAGRLRHRSRTRAAPSSYGDPTAMPPSGLNYLAYSNPRFDALLDSASTSFDVAAAHRYASRAYQVIADDAPGRVALRRVRVRPDQHRASASPAMRADGWWQHLADWTVPVAERIDRDRIGLGAPTR